MKVYVLCQQHVSHRGDWIYESTFSNKAAALRYCETVLKVDAETWEIYLYGGWVSPWMRIEEFDGFQYRWVIFEEDLLE